MFARGGDAQDPGEAQPQNDKDEPTDDAQDRKDVDQALGEVGGGQPEQREDGGEAEDEGDRVTDGEPSTGAGKTPSGDGDRAQLAQVGGHEG
jgi:hypothetical protein